MDAAPVQDYVPVLTQRQARITLAAMEAHPENST
jgi:hypothetical protein